MFTEILLFLALLCVVIYLWMKERYKYFEKLDMEYVKPYFLLGSMKDVFLKKDNFVDCAETVYKSGKSGIMGMFETIAPVFLVRNPEIARQIFIKDFNHFTDHRKMFNDGSLFDHSLFQLEGEKWKDMRSTLSPAYTGNKMRGMFELMKEIAQQASVHLKEKEIGNEINLKDFFSRFANDVIASTAFGFKINSFEDQDNEFFKMGKDVTTFDGWDMFKAIVINVCNKLARMLGLSFISKKAHNYYMNLVLNAMKYRSENQIFRPDMINMLMEVKGIGVQGTAEHKPHFNWTDEEIVAQCFILFFAGFDTVSTTLSFAGHELMENPEVQERLKEEVREIKESLNGGPLTYEAVGNMKYAEAVIFETLRKWPQLPLVDRMCTKAIDLEDPETGKVINLKPGDTIQVSSVGIHRDEKYFPDPMKFCPDRFLDENKKTSMNYFMGFGMGPRMCIGNRFAMMEIKALLFYLMQHISFEKSEKSTIPMILDPTTPQMEPKGGIWVKVAADKH